MEITNILSMEEENSKFIINETFSLISAIRIINESLPSDITYIADGTPENYTFIESAKTLTHISVSENNQLEYIGSYAFYSCRKLEYVDLSNCEHLKILGYWSFADCSNLNTFLFPPNIDEFHSNAFRAVPLCTTINLTKVKNIEKGPFVNTKLSFTCEESNEYIKEYENNIYSSDYSILLIVSYSTKSMKFHPNTTIIGGVSFSSTSLEEIILPNQITNIEIHAFHYNYFIKKIVFPQTLSVLNVYAVKTLPNLETLYFAEGLEMVNITAIESTGVKYIHIPKSLTNAVPNSMLAPTARYVTYYKEQYQMLLDAGIPKRALIHEISCNMNHHINILHYAIFIVFSS